MSARPTRTDLLQDFLDGVLDPAREAEIARLLRENPEWRREHAAMRDAFLLLDSSIDVNPPADLVSAALAEIAVRRARVHRPGFFARFERGFVLLGAGALAVALVVAGVLPAGEPLAWVGTVVVEGTRSLSAVKGTAVVLASAIGAFDWVAHVVQSIGVALGTLFLSSVRDLAPALPGSVLLTILSAIALWRAERGRRERGTPHGFHLFA